MSRTATAEYIGAKRRAYAAAVPAKRHRLLEEVVETTGYSRKYANRLLTGSRKFRDRKGRGKTYTEEAGAVLKRIWLEAGCPCTPYLKAEMERWVAEYAGEVAHIPPGIRGALLRMSASTMSRILAGEPRVKPGWSKANKRSGRQGGNEIEAKAPCASGETVRACQVPPGDVQVDTFALGGGNPSESFFWILDATDRKTQWTVLSPTWNRGQHTTCKALAHIRDKFPFAMLSIHADNGGEILNHHVAAWLGRQAKAPFLWRSRPRKSNDNAHVEEKNARPDGNCSAKSASTARTCKKSSRSSATTGRTSATSSVPARCWCPRKSGKTAKASGAVTMRPARRSSVCWKMES